MSASIREPIRPPGETGGGRFLCVPRSWRPNLHPVIHLIPHNHLRTPPKRPLAPLLGIPFPPLLGVPFPYFFLLLDGQYPLRLLRSEDCVDNGVGGRRYEATAGGAAGGGGEGSCEWRAGNFGVGGLAAAVVGKNGARCLGDGGGEVGECWCCCLGARRN